MVALKRWTMSWRLWAPVLETFIVLFTILPCESATVYTVNITTPRYRDFIPLTPPGSFNISTMSRLRFSVEICSHANILLSQDRNRAMGLYEIIIGNKHNKVSVILENKDDKTVEISQRPDPVSCDEFRKFFVGWKDGVVRVGTVADDFNQYGEVLETEFLKYWDETPFPVHYVFAAGVPGVSGKWRFEFTESSTRTTAPPVDTSISDDFTTTLSTMTTDVISTEIMSTFTLVTTDNGVTKSKSLDTTVEPSTQQSAHCNCRCFFSWNASGIEPLDPEEVASHLLVPANSTSAARRRRTSATDDRPSSTAIGAVGIVCLLCPLLFIICLDLATIHK